MVKDLLKTLNSINNDNNLSLEEKYLLTILIKYHNYEFNYAFPSYEILMTECSTKRKAKISKILKGLLEKQYITIKKARGNNNLYIINRYLYYVDDNNKKIKSQEQKPRVDSDGQVPLPNKINADELIKEEPKLEEEIAKETNKPLNVIIKAIEHAKSNKAKNIKKYAIACLNKGYGENNNAYVKNEKVGFNNFEGRQYDYDLLEKRLLGWVDVEEYDTNKSCTIGMYDNNNPYKYNEPNGYNNSNNYEKDIYAV